MAWNPLTVLVSSVVSTQFSSSASFLFSSPSPSPSETVTVSSRLSLSLLHSTFLLPAPSSFSLSACVFPTRAQATGGNWERALFAISVTFFFLQHSRLPEIKGLPLPLLDLLLSLRLLFQQLHLPRSAFPSLRLHQRFFLTLLKSTPANNRKSNRPLTPGAFF